MALAIWATAMSALRTEISVATVSTDVGTLLVSCVAAWVTVTLLRFQLFWWNVRRGLGALPVPAGSVPFFGHALVLMRNTPWDMMHQWVKDAKGGLIRIDFLGKSGIVVAKPSLLRQVLNTKQRQYGKDIDMSYKPFLDILGNGLVTSQGKHWRRQRNLLSAAFRIDILEETGPVAKRAVDRLSAKLEAVRGTGESIELAEEFRVMTLQVIGELILSLSPEESARVFPELYLPIVTEANARIFQPWRAFLPTPGLFKYKSTVRKLNTYMKDLIRRRWAERQARVAADVDMESPDILERVLASISPQDFDEGVVHQLCDEIKTFILAGHETSASMLTWAVYQLTQNKDCLDAALAESRSVFPVGRAEAPPAGQDEFQAVPLPSHDELKKLTYTVNLLKETLRLYSLVPVVTRVADADDTLGDQFIPKGTKIFICIKATHLDPENWENPQQFDPRRFEQEFDGYAFLPFINGPRNCLGQHLALLEARIVMALLLQRFKFTPRDASVGDVHEFMVPVCPKEGMFMLID